MGNIKWFPMYVDNDPALDYIEREFGQFGFAVVVQMIRFIHHGIKGYYCELNEEVLLSFVDKLRLDSRRSSEGGRSSGYRSVSEILSASVRRGIFNKALFDKYKILTNEEIQKNYLRSVKRRAFAEIDARFMLVKLADLPKNVKIIGDLHNNSEKMYDNETTHYITNDSSSGIGAADGGFHDTVNEEERSIVPYYLQVINPNISKSICDILMSYQKDGMCYDCLAKILDDCRNDNHLSWSYINAVLGRLHRAGVKTVSDYQKDREAFLERKNQKQAFGHEKKPYRRPEGFERIDL